jgi:hypothetical protein
MWFAVQVDLERPRAEIASSIFSGADGQVGSIDYRFINSPLTGVAELPSLSNRTERPLDSDTCR